MSTLYRNLSEELAAHIDQGVYQVGERMPGLRNLSRLRKVSMATAVAAYRTLEDAGYLEARDRSGYYVCERRKLTLALPDQTTPQTQPVPVKRRDVVIQMLNAGNHPDIIPLGAAVPHAELMPQAVIAKVTAVVARQQRVISNRYTLPPGEPNLVHQIAKRLSLTGCRIRPEDIVVTTGAQEALWLVLRSITAPGDVVALESPCYYGLLLILESLGLQALEIPTHPQTGIALDALKHALERWDIKACVMVPSFSNPLGYCMGDAEKNDLVKLLAEYAVPLVEDDIYGELPHRGERPTPAKFWDKKGNNFLCSSLSKTLSPGMRVGWIAGPVKRYEIGAEKFVLNAASSSLPQLVAAQMLESGAFDRHLKQMRATVAGSVASTMALIEDHFPEGTHITRPQGGFVVWVELPPGFDTRQLMKRGLAQGVSIAPGSLFSSAEKYHRFMRLNCAVPQQSLETAIIRLAKLLRKK